MCRSQRCNDGSAAGRHTVGCSAGDGLLHHDTDLLRQLGSASGARLHDRGRGRAGPAPPPARRGRLLPDRHRRARRQRGPCRRGRRHAAQAVLRRGVRALPPADDRDGLVERLLHPHHRSRARAPRAGLRPAAVRRRRPLRGHLRRPLLQLLRGLLRRERPDPARQPVPDPPPPRRLGGGEQLVLPAHEVGAEAAGAVRRQPRLRPPPRPLQRGPLDDRPRSRGRLVHPGQRQLGHPGAVGAEPDHLRLGGRAAQLPHRAGVRPRPRRHRRVLADLAAPDGEGHPAAARHHLAGDADGGRLRAAARPVRARLLHHAAARR